MRVAFSLDNLNVGGTELNAVRTAEHLVRHGVELHLVVFREHGPLRARYEDMGVRIHPVPLTSFGSWRTPGRAKALADWVRRARIEVLHAHDMYSNVFSVPVARLAGVPFVVASRRWWRPPRRHAFLTRLAHPFASVIVTNSHRVAQLVRETEGVSRERIEVIPNFVDEQSFEAPPHHEAARLRGHLGVGPDALIIGCVANLLPVKGHRTLLRAFGRLESATRPLRLVVVGDGPSRSELERLTFELELQGSVIFVGQQPSRPFHHLFDIAVLASTSEGLPNSLLESMAAGKPVVATSVGGIPDIIDGQVGILVDPEDPGALARGLDRLVRDSALRRRLGEQGRERAAREHSAGPVVERLMELYRRGVESSRSPRQAARKSTTSHQATSI